MSQKDKTIFDLLGDINYNKVKWEDQLERDKKLFSPFMINRFLSMDIHLIDMVNEIQFTCNGLTPEDIYKIYLDILPKRKFFAKYIGTKTELENEKLLNFLSQYISFSKREIEEAITRMDKDELISELEKYGLTKKEIKQKFKL
jgi:hypothetical protein